MAARRAPDAAEALNVLDRGVAAQVLQQMPLEAAIQTLNEPHLDGPAELLRLLPAETAATILAGIHPDRRADIFRDLPASLRHALLARLDWPGRGALEQLLRYPPRSAGGLMTTDFVSAPTDWTVERTLEAYPRCRAGTKEAVYTVCLLDPETERLVKVISLGRLVVSGAQMPTCSARRGPTSPSPSRR